MMTKNRVEAFSDGVIAIIITIMVLEFKVPQTISLPELCLLWPIFLSYVLSFIYVGIYWNNHHHLFQSIKKINGKILWANHSLLFCLSLVPFATSLLARSQFSGLATAIYGGVLFSSAFAYYILTLSLLNEKLLNKPLEAAVGQKRKEKISLALYLFAVLVSYWIPIMAIIIYGVVAVIWINPDSRLEKIVNEAN